MNSESEFMPCGKKGLLQVKCLGLSEYQPTLEAMRQFTQTRTAQSPDQLWLLEHPPVFTQGQAGKDEHLLDVGDIAVVASDRGGQVTYHGPGQLIAYTMLDLQRLGIGVRDLVSILECVLINFLARYGVEGKTKSGAPGVYVGDKKIASLGLRVKKGCTFHGLALNVDMDLSPFERINPCGYPGLDMTQLVSHSAMPVSVESLAMPLAKCLAVHFDLSIESFAD